MTYPFRYKNNRLYCEEIDLTEFSKNVPTPFYLYSKAELDYNCRQINTIGKDYNFLPCYALKANYNPTLLKIITAHGFGADVVSGGEIFFALKTGFHPEKIVFAGVGKTAQEIELAINSNIRSINIESAGELNLIGQLAEKAGKKIKFAIRVNPDIDAKTHAYISTGLSSNKFGVTRDEALRLFTMGNKNPYLEAEGVHVHIGSQITEKGPYMETAKFLRTFKADLKQEGIHIRSIDLGGGIGINYKNPVQNAEQERTFLGQILPEYLKAFQDLDTQLVVELGRSVIGSAGMLISKVLLTKRAPGKKFVIVDAAMNNLIRPSLYQAYHEIIPLSQAGNDTESADIVGPVCESGDFLAKERELSVVGSGDFLAVCSTGAYGQALASNYNLRPTVKEYLVDKDKIQCISAGISIEDIANRYQW